MTAYRKDQLEKRPLILSEFIGPLSLTHATMDDLYEKYEKFTDHVTGDKKGRDLLEKAL